MSLIERLVEGTRMVVTIPIRTVSGLNVREHWRQRARRVKSERQATALLLPRRILPPLPCVVTLTRLAPRLLDDDAVPGSCKGVRDQIAAQYGVDDRDPRLAFKYGQEKCKTYGVRAEIETTVAELGKVG